MSFELQKGQENHALSDTPPLGEMDRMLIKMLAARAGVDPKKLEADYRRGDLSALLSSLPSDSRNKVSEILSDPAKAAAAQKSGRKSSPVGCNPENHEQQTKRQIISLSPRLFSAPIHRKEEEYAETDNFDLSSLASILQNEDTLRSLSGRWPVQWAWKISWKVHCKTCRSRRRPPVIQIRRRLPHPQPDHRQENHHQPNHQNVSQSQSSTRQCCRINLNSLLSNPALLRTLSSVMQAMNQQGPEYHFLKSLKPLLRPEKAPRVDQAMQIMQMVKALESVEGGGLSGLAGCWDRAAPTENRTAERMNHQWPIENTVPKSSGRCSWKQPSGCVRCKDRHGHVWRVRSNPFPTRTGFPAHPS